MKTQDPISIDRETYDNIKYWLVRAQVAIKAAENTLARGKKRTNPSVTKVKKAKKGTK